MRHKCFIQPALILGLLFLGMGVVLPLAGQEEPLTLRVNDSAGDPEGLVAVVFRTYSPRPVGSGQTCVAPRGPNCRSADPDLPCGFTEGTGGPLASLESVKVFSTLDDAKTTVTFDPVSQRTDVSFVSKSGTINETDGPFAVFYYRLRADAVPEDVWLMDLEVTETFLVDAEGDPIPVDLRPGDLTVRHLNDPYAFEADGAEVVAGDIAQLALETEELFDILSGEVVFLYDPAIASGPPVVTVDPRYGAATISTTETTPGELMISFTASLADPLNQLPGQILQIHLPTRQDIPVGTVSPVNVDPSSTLVAPGGQQWNLVFDGGVVEFVVGEVFDDDFESGDTLAWSAATP
ncbi:MAG: hypothetical protein K8J08_14545 [Thermoanaerobaculia bacterium]|nr:hypothetical protein [Thermoanaerobaculia bacterium]